MTNNISLNDRGHDGKLAMSFIGTVARAYAKLSIQLHQAACLAFYRAAQYGDPDALNAFYGALRVNDQTALRVWVGQHATYIDLDNNEVRPWIKFTKDKGFALIKGREEFRKDMFTLDMDNEDGKQALLALKPFYDKNVKDKDALTLEALLTMLEKAADRVTKQAKEENIALPADILNLTTSIKNTTAKEKAALERIKE